MTIRHTFPARNVWLFLAIALALVSAGTCGSTFTSLAIEDVTVIPMDVERVLEHYTVLVESDRIIAMGPTAVIGVPADAMRVDGRGRFLLPGLIDAHDHVRRVDLDSYLAAGVTTVRNMWGHSGVPPLASSIEAGTLRGPSIFSTSPRFDGPPAQWPETQLIVQSSEAAALVEVRANAGWHVLKVYQRLSGTVYDAIAAEASARWRRCNFRSSI